MELHDLGNRIRAARGYAGGMSQEDLATQLNMSLGWLKTVESGRGVKDIEAIGLIERLADICHLPRDWFTADWSQLDPTYEPPADALRHLESTVGGVSDRLDGVMRQLQPCVARLDRLENDRVDTATFTTAVDLIRQAIDALAERLPSTDDDGRPPVKRGGKRPAP